MLISPDQKNTAISLSSTPFRFHEIKFGYYLNYTKFAQDTHGNLISFFPYVDISIKSSITS